MSAITSLFRLVLTSSWMAVVVIVLIILAKTLLKDRLSPRWSYLLWMLLPVRLLIPWSPESEWSIFNLLAPGADEASNVKFSPSSWIPLSMEAPFWSLLMVLWATGVAITGFITFQTNRRFAAHLKREALPNTNPTLLALVEECRTNLSIRQNVPLVETGLVSTPSLYGVWGPKLLIPKSVYLNMSTKEWKYMFLHELSHLKRKDVAVNVVMNILLILHWFNPVLWIACRKMREDQEIACDSLALTKISQEENRDYASTLIKLLDYWKKPLHLSNAVGIFENTCYLKRRISTIALNKNSYRWSAIGLLTIAFVAALTLTGSKAETANADNETGTKTCTFNEN